MTLRYFSAFSGIEAASVAWRGTPLGWECAGLAEIDKFASRVLAARFPNVVNYGDVTKITEAQIKALGRVDVFIFGSPCQDLSVAGKRKGLAGERSGLFHDAMRIVGWLRQHCGLRFALWENVPGAFTSNAGLDFAVVVGELAGLADVAAIVPPEGRDKKGCIKWGNEGAIVGDEAMVEWSTLDAQWFGVAQRRRRVFALADFGDWAGRPPILLECEGMRGDSAPSRGAREEVAGTLTARLGEGVQGRDAYTGLLRPVMAFGGNNSAEIDVATNLTAHGGPNGRLDFKSETFIVHHEVAHTLRAEGFDASEDWTGRGTPLIAFHHNAQPQHMNFDEHTTASLTCSQFAAVALHDSDWKVRRLTPRECERLQAFEDDWTKIKGAKDGPRYKALGNSMAVSVINWIGRSIESSLMEFWK